MPPRIPDDEGRGALREWTAAPTRTPRPVLATAVRWTLQELARAAPGNTLEVRVPPFGVIQCLPGPRHTRGTPPAVVETDPQTWLGLTTGGSTWAEAVAGGRVHASGDRADLSLHLPLTGLG